MRGNREKGRERVGNKFLYLDKGLGKEGEGEGWTGFPPSLINTIPPIEEIWRETELNLLPPFLSTPLLPLSLLYCYSNKVLWLV